MKSLDKEYSFTSEWVIRVLIYDHFINLYFDEYSPEINS